MRDDTNPIWRIVDYILRKRLVSSARKFVRGIVVVFVVVLRLRVTFYRRLIGSPNLFDWFQKMRGILRSEMSLFEMMPREIKSAMAAAMVIL